MNSERKNATQKDTFFTASTIVEFETASPTAQNSNGIGSENFYG